MASKCIFFLVNEEHVFLKKWKTAFFIITTKNLKQGRKNQKRLSFSFTTISLSAVILGKVLDM